MGKFEEVLVFVKWFCFMSQYLFKIHAFILKTAYTEEARFVEMVISIGNVRFNMNGIFCEEESFVKKKLLS